MDSAYICMRDQPQKRRRRTFDSSHCLHAARPMLMIILVTLCMLCCTHLAAHTTMLGVSADPLTDTPAAPEMWRSEDQPPSSSSSFSSSSSTHRSMNVLSVTDVATF